MHASKTDHQRLTKSADLFAPKVSQTQHSRIQRIISFQIRLDVSKVLGKNQFHRLYDSTNARYKSYIISRVPIHCPEHNCSSMQLQFAANSDGLVDTPIHLHCTSCPSLNSGVGGMGGSPSIRAPAPGPARVLAGGLRW